MLSLFIPIIFGLIGLVEGVICARSIDKVDTKFRDYLFYNDRRRAAIKRRQAAIERSTRPATSPIIPGLNLPLPDDSPVRAGQEIQVSKKKTSKAKPKAEEPVLKPNPNKLVRPDEFFDEPRQE